MVGSALQQQPDPWPRGESLMTKKPKHSARRLAIAPKNVRKQTDISTQPVHHPSTATSRERVESGTRPVDKEIRAAGERIGYTPTEPKRTDPRIHHSMLVISDHVSKLTAAVVSWRDDCDDGAITRECAGSLLDDLAELNREIWRLRWDVDGLADHEAAS
jgi:hypothetical protein